MANLGSLGYPSLSPETFPKLLSRLRAHDGQETASHTSTYSLRCPTANPEPPESPGQRQEITDEKNQWVSLEFSADHFSKCYHYAMSFVILIVAFFFFNFKLSDSAEITHSKKARFVVFFFLLFWSNSGLGFLRIRSFFRFL